MNMYHLKNHQFHFKLLVLIIITRQLVNVSSSMLTTKNVQFIKPNHDTSSQSSQTEVTNKGIARPSFSNNHDNEVEMTIKSPAGENANLAIPSSVPSTFPVTQSVPPSESETSFREPILLAPTFTPRPSSELPVSISLFGEVIPPQPNEKSTEKSLISGGNEDEVIEIEMEVQQQQMHLMGKSSTFYIIFAIAFCALALHYILLRLTVSKFNSSRLKVV